MENPDPEHSPLVRHVLYTNEVQAMFSSWLAQMMFRAHPDRIRSVLEDAVENFDRYVASARTLAERFAESSGEPSGWPEDEPADEPSDGN